MRLRISGPCHRSQWQERRGQLFARRSPRTCGEYFSYLLNLKPLTTSTISVFPALVPQVGYRALHGGSPEDAREQIDKIITAYPNAERAVARAVRQNSRSALHRPINAFLTDVFGDRGVNASALSATERTKKVVSWCV